MTLFFYNLALAVALVLSAPWWLWKMATTHKYRQGLGERLGCVPGRLRRGGKPLLWLHAVSVGEVLAVSRLVGELDRAFPEHRVVISTTTRTGQELARQRFGAERVFYSPLDLGWAVRAYLEALRPEMLILAETEFWPNLLSACLRRGIPVTVVNARISDRSWPRYLRLRRLWRPLLNRLALVLAQSETDAARLRALGCVSESVGVAGNLKFDVRAAQESDATRLLRAYGAGLRFVVAGSTLEGEEAALLEAWPALLEADAQLAMVLAPRHPERFAQVAALLERAGVAWVRRSAWPGDAVRSSNAPGHGLSRAENSSNPTRASAPVRIQPGQIVLLDTIGELASVYALAAAAFVGGSVAAAGGHNPLEPAQFGVPIAMGPHYANFRAITEDLRAHKALRIAEKGTLAVTLTELLTNRAEAEAMGARAKQVFDAQAGATARCVEALRALLVPRPHDLVVSQVPESGPGAPRIVGLITNLPSHGTSHRSGDGAQAMSASRYLLLPLAPLYRLGLALRAWRLRSGQEQVQRLRWPVISIGNLSLGGAGKTPLTIALARALTARKLRVDVLSRGYGRRSTLPLPVDPGGTAEEFGDEPLVIAREAGVPVFVAAERYEAGLLAEAKGDIGVHLLDDGFQHRQLYREVNLLLLNRRDWHGWLLPAGNLREPLSAMRRADAIVIPAEEPELEARLRVRGWTGPVWRVRRRMEPPAVARPVVAFCGIAQPEQFFAGLEAAGMQVASRVAFRDHHRYIAHDLDCLRDAARSVNAAAFVTTEKDRARLGAMVSRLIEAAPLHTAGLRAELEHESAAVDWMLARIG